MAGNTDLIATNFMPLMDLSTIDRVTSGLSSPMITSGDIPEGYQERCTLARPKVPQSGTRLLQYR